eukprot:264131-Rhodomonas_salina.1
MLSAVLTTSQSALYSHTERRQRVRWGGRLETNNTPLLIFSPCSDCELAKIRLMSFLPGFARAGQCPFLTERMCLQALSTGKGIRPKSGQVASLAIVLRIRNAMPGPDKHHAAGSRSSL